MDRRACVDVPALPLQLLLRSRPEWHGRPAAVVAEDAPQAPLLWVNERARRRRVLPGMRYAAALTLARDLEADEVESAEVEVAVEEIATCLRDFTPHVEPGEVHGKGEDRGTPGVFWLDASGLEGLFESASAWGREIEAALAEAGFETSVVVGFSRFGTYALARAGRGVTALASPEEERRRARGVPLARLDLEPSLRDRLAKLGVETVGRLLELPAAGLRERYGAEIWRLHRLARGDLWAPLQPEPAPEPRDSSIELERPDDHLERLLFAVKRLLDPLLDELERRRERVRRLVLRLRLDEGPRHEAILTPAAPTREAKILLDLARLRLERTELGAGVVELEVEIEPEEDTGEQLALWRQDQRRDPAAASRALARLKAELGEAAVVRARLLDKHLPGASFLWEPVGLPLTGIRGPGPGVRGDSGPHAGTETRGYDSPPVVVAAVSGREDHGRATMRARRPAATGTEARRLVRRIYTRSIALPPRPHHLRDDGWLIRGVEHGAVMRLVGPFTVDGGWWIRPVERDYHFAETRRGDLLWVYYDRRSRRWYLEGRVE